MHGGEIGYDSHAGGGTTFYFTLPVNRPREMLAEEKDRG
jgi:signal transduction histidine kinase